MATVIDVLMVTLGIDATKFKEGAKQTDEALNKTSGNVQKTNKDLEEWGKNAAASIGKLRNEVLGFLAVFTAGVGLKSFVESTISSTASLGRMSENLNMSKKDLAEWQLANKNAGGSVEGMTAQLEGAQKAVSDYRLGLDNGQTNVFRNLGGKEEDLKDTETYLRAQADIVKGLGDKYGTDVARNKASAMGITADSFNLMKQGSVVIDAQRHSFDKLAQAEADAAEPAEKLRKKWDLLTSSFKADAIKLLVPVLTRFSDWLTANQDRISKWAEEVGRAIESFVKNADDAAQAVGGWKNVFIGLLALKVLSFVSSLVSLASALVSVGSALGVIGGTAGTGALGVLSKLILKGGVGLALLTHADELNTGEGDQLATLRAKGDADFARRGVGAGQGNAAQSQVVDSLTAKGWTREQAVGIAANLKQESNFNESAVGDSGSAYGIAQWHGDRQAAFKAKYGKDMKGSSLEEQLTFLNFELRQGNEQAAGNKLKATTSATEAAGVVSRHYERPRATEAEITRRAQIASQIDAQEKTRLASASVNGAIRVASIAGNRTAPANAGGNSTSEVTINGPINIATKATDADGIAKSIGSAISRQVYVAHANTGLA